MEPSIIRLINKTYEYWGINIGSSDNNLVNDLRNLLRHYLVDHVEAYSSFLQSNFPFHFLNWLLVDDFSFEGKSEYLSNKLFNLQISWLQWNTVQSVINVGIHSFPGFLRYKHNVEEPSHLNRRRHFIQMLLLGIMNTHSDWLKRRFHPKFVSWLLKTQ